MRGWGSKSSGFALGDSAAVRVALVCLGMLTLASPIAHADTTASAGGVGGYPSNVVVQIPVEASVAASCGYATGADPSGTYDIGDAGGAFSKDVPFTLQCNCPLAMAIISSNGGLLSPGTSPPGYTRLSPYNVTLVIQGETASASTTCAAADLEATSSATCILRGTASDVVGLKLNDISYNESGSYLRVASPGYSGSDVLLASDNYSDTLTVTLAAVP